jgi:tripartite-type tricarboxylate transporter receptor subunit TctC
MQDKRRARCSSGAVAVLIGSIAVSGLSPRGAIAADAYPARPIRLIVPFGAGGNADIVGRTVAAGLGARVGQQVVVDNRPGGSSIIGTEMVARAAPDGHTLLLIANLYTVLPSLASKLPYDTLKDFVPVSLVGTSPQIVVATAGLPVNSLRDLIALARAKPGSLNYGSTGVGATGHMAGALLGLMAGIQLTHVPYKGTPQILTDVIAGHMQLGIPSMTSALPHVRTGKLKALGLTSPRRSPQLPDVPAIAEAGVPGYQAVIWTGVLAPAATPRAIVERLAVEIAGAMRTAEAAERYAALGAEARVMPPTEFNAFLLTEIEQWARVVRETGMKGELTR